MSTALSTYHITYMLSFLFPRQLNASSGFPDNYTTCAVQTTGLHFFNHAPFPSGQQFTGLGVADSVARSIPEAEINNKTSAATVAAAPLTLDVAVNVGSCGNPPAPLNSTSGPNVLIIGDSISEPGSGYGPAVERMLQHPRPGQGNSYLTGALATVQHSGGSGSNQAGPTTNGAACIASWVGQDKWDGECAAVRGRMGGEGWGRGGDGGVA